MLKNSVLTLATILQAYGMKDLVAREFAAIIFKAVRMTGVDELDPEKDIVITYHTSDDYEISIKIEED